MIKAVSPQELTEYLCTKLKEDENHIVEFGLYCSDKDNPSLYNVSSWYYIQLRKNEKYMSQYLIVDYCGGEDARAISIPWTCKFNQRNINDIAERLECYIKERDTDEVYLDTGITWDECEEGDKIEVDGRMVQKVTPVILYNAMDPETGEMLYVNGETNKIEEVKR
jgi:hypothetical protein